MLIEQVCQYGNRLKVAVGMQNHSARTVAGMTGSDARVVTVVLKTLGPQNLVLRCAGGGISDPERSGSGQRKISGGWFFMRPKRVYSLRNFRLVF